MSAVARCTALRSLSLDPIGSDYRQLRQLAALTNLTSLRLPDAGPYRELVETLRQLPRLQELGLAFILDADLSLTSRLSSLTSLKLPEHDNRNQIDLGALAAATGLRYLHVGMEVTDQGSVEALAQLTQLSSLSFVVENGFDPTPLSTLTGLSCLQLFGDTWHEGAAIAAMAAGVLRNLASLECSDLDGGRVDPELLLSMSCASLHVRHDLVMDCSLLSPDRPPLPRLQSLRLGDSPSSCRRVLRLGGLPSLSIRSHYNECLSDTDCAQLVRGCPCCGRCTWARASG